MKIEDKMITISFSREDFDRAISKLESLYTLLQETMDTLKEARDNSLRQHRTKPKTRERESDKIET